MMDKTSEVLNVCDTCGDLYRSKPPHYAHACKRVACSDCPHPEMCEAAESCPPSPGEEPEPWQR